jgi:hypothetical protein
MVPLAVAGALVGCAAPAAAPPPEPLHPWAWEMPYCVVYQPEEYAAPAHRVSARVEEQDAPAGQVITEVYEPGWGARAVAEIQDVVGTCGSFEYGEAGEAGEFREQNVVVEVGFTADDSLLVETVRLAPPEPMQTSYTAVVRHGEVVVTWRTENLGAEETLCLAGAQRATCVAGQA